ncbi:MAG TPA: hypothetical protein VFD94_00335 [Jatrophihabitans sp.]|nr:hypothetical protein [Jatrophihabitans sp.]
MDPQLFKIEALAEPGCYSLTFQLDGGDERAVVARVRDQQAVLPANAFTGWPADAPSHRAVVSAVQLLHQARELAGPSRSRLIDLAGGWDVGLGNVVLHDGWPSCVSHGRLAEPEPEAEPGTFRCAECGAAAGLTSD